MIELIQRRLDSYNAAGPVEEEQPQGNPDVQRFLKEPERRGLALWNERFFHNKVDQLVSSN